jgi:hypothetical protein
MVSNQNPPFPAFAGANPVTADEDPNDQAIVGADDAEEDARRSGAEDLEGPFGRLTPDHPHRDTDGVPVGEADVEADEERAAE